ncbi:MAG: CvpA family protein [Candidatus Omnitrophica bacterium]|nr:CvpA family protein [Candidatus Omnitrophota bacterium]
MEILTKINWVDIIILIIIVRTSYVSLQDGLSHEILPLIGSVCMLVFSLHYYSKIALFLYNNGLALPMALLELLGFAISAVFIGLLFRFLKMVIDKIIKVSWHPLIEKFGGLAAGIVRGTILASLILIMLMLIPLSYLQWSVRDRSLTGIYFLRIGPSIYEKASVFLPTVPVSAKELMAGLMSDKSVASGEEKPSVKK